MAETTPGSTYRVLGKPVIESSRPTIVPEAVEPLDMVKPLGGGEGSVLVPRQQAVEDIGGQVARFLGQLPMEMEREQVLALRESLEERDIHLSREFNGLGEN